MAEPNTSDAPTDKGTVREQRDRFLAFAFASADLFFEISQEGRITHAFGAARGITGIDETTLIGKKWLELFSVYEQATMIQAFERARPGVRIGPMLVNLGDAAGARKAILTGIKMPDSPKFYIALGVTSAIMARLAHALAEQSGFEILSKETFCEAISTAVKRTRINKQKLVINVFDFAPTQHARGRMGEGAWAKMRAALAELLIAESYDGYSAAEIIDGRFAVLTDQAVKTQTLLEKIITITRQCDPSGQGLSVQGKAILADVQTLPLQETERAAIHIMDEFQKIGIHIPMRSLDDAFESFMTSNAPRIKELQSAIERSAFNIYFQPIVSLSTSEASWYEIYCRFEGGNTREWIAFADNVGLITALDLAICERVISHIKFKAGGTWTKFSLNVALKSAENSDFCEALMERLDKHKGLAERLMFEIIGSPYIKDWPVVINFCTELSKRGYKFALDDFSPEPACAEHLEKIKPPLIKIDSKFVRRILGSQRDFTLIRELGVKCAGLGIDVVAKGIEDRTHAETLANMGLPYGQGYYFGKPTPKAEFNPPRE